MKLFRSSRNFTPRSHVMPCLTTFSYGVWDLKRLSWAENHSVNHAGPNSDINSLNHIREFALRRMLSGKILRKLSVVSIDIAASNYWHICTNVIPDIAAAKEQFAFDNIIVSDDAKFLREYIDLLEIKATIYHLRNKAIVCENLVMAENCSCLPINYDPFSALYYLREKILRVHSLSDRNMPKKVFVERRDSNNASQLRRIFPVEALHDDLKNNQWQIVYLEDLCVLDQIKIFFNADKIMAVHGAALTNIMYCGETTCIYEIVHAKGAPNNFFKLSKYLGLTNYIQVTCDGLLPDQEEERLKLYTNNNSTNPLPLSYNKKVKKIIFS